VYKIKVKKGFSAAHQIYTNVVDCRGNKCERLHGHNWEVEICLSAEKLSGDGMVIDFRKVKQKLSQVLEKLDHKYLNEILTFSPTSENIARYIFDELDKDINKEHCSLSTVSVKESENTQAIYAPDKSKED